MRIVSQTAYRKMQRNLRKDEAAMVAARAAALQARRDGKGRMAREELFWRYCDWKKTVAHYRAQLADCLPSDVKHPEWSPATRKRNPHLVQ